MTSTVTIDFVSDVVCPWCALGATALEQAIANVAGSAGNTPLDGHGVIALTDGGLEC